MHIIDRVLDKYWNVKSNAMEDGIYYIQRKITDINAVS